jgi:hypothetical protein
MVVAARLIVVVLINSLRVIPFFPDMILPPWLNRAFRLSRHKLIHPDNLVIDLSQVSGKFGSA